MFPNICVLNIVHVLVYLFDMPLQMDGIFTSEGDLHHLDNVTTAQPIDAYNEPFIKISEETFKQTTFIVKVILTPVVCVLGIIGNSIGLVVLRHDSQLQSPSFYVYMRALMTFHIVTAVNRIVFTIPNFIEIYNYYLGNYLASHYGRIRLYVDKLFSCLSAGVLTAMSTERLRALLNPFTFKNIWLSKYPFRVVAVMFIMFAVFLIPFTVCCKPTTFVNSENRTEYRTRERSDFWKHFMDEYVMIETIVQHYVAPLCVLTANLAIPIVYYRYLNSTVLADNVTTPRKKQQKKMTTIVLCIVALYLLMSVCPMFALTLDYVNEEYSFSGRHSAVYYFFMMLGKFFEHVAAAFDCIIYIFVSKHFWRIFLIKFCKRCVHRPKSVSSVCSGSSNNRQLY